MSGGRSVLLAAGLSLCACLSDVRLELPPLPAGTAGVLIAIEEERTPGSLVQPTTIVALPAERVPGFSLPIDVTASLVRISVLAYDRPLSSMLIAEGVVPPASGPRSRPLPEPQEVQTTTLARGTDASSWVSVSLSAALMGYRIEAFDWNDCFEIGGCPSRAGACSVPCPPIPVPIPPAPPRSPDPPELPAFGPCPSGWSPAVELGAQWCAPQPPSFSCPPGSVPRLGEAECSPLGAPCPAGLWPEDLPAAPTWFVAPGGSGDGTRAAPFGTIGDALISAAPGDVIALAKGRYQETFDSSGRLLIGACARDTVIETPLLFTTGTSLLRGLSVAAERPLVLGDSAEVHLEGVELLGEDTRLVGVIANHAAVLTGTNVSIRGFRDGALFAQGDSRVELDDLVVHGANDAITSAGTASVQLVRAIVSLTGSSGSGAVLAQASSATISESWIESEGAGIGVIEDASLVVERSAIIGRTYAAVAVFSRGGYADANLDAVLVAGSVVADGGHLIASDVIVDDVPGPHPYGGVNVIAGRAALERVIVRATEHAPVYIGNTAEASLSDLTLRGGDTCLAISTSGNVTASRLRLQGCLESGLHSFPGPPRRILDCSIELDPASGVYGVVAGSELSLERLLITHAVNGVLWADAAVHLQDASIVTRVSEDSTSAALRAGGFGPLSVDRALLRGPSRAGIAVSNGDLRAHDLELSGFEYGITVMNASVELRRVRISSFESTAMVTDRSLAPTEHTFRAGEVQVSGGPTGLDASNASITVLTGFHLEGLTGNAVLAGPSHCVPGDRGLRLEVGLIAGSAVGLNLPCTDVPPELFSDVAFVDNQIDVLTGDR